MAEPQAHRPYSMLRLLSLLHGVVAVSVVILIGLGIGIKYGEAALTRVLGPASEYRLHISHLYLALGCLAVPLALVGWCGSKKESRGSLVCCQSSVSPCVLQYLVTVAVILVVEITVASVVLAFFPLVRDLEHDIVTLRRSYRGYNETGDFSAQWNSVMEKLKCCGVNNYTDFPGSSFSLATGHSYPRGCCKSLGTAACDGHNVSPSVIHQEGCFRRLLKITKTQSYTLSWVSLGTAAMQLPGALATLLLFIKLG
ncbi:LOW QUALITY PROTEIN: tetraspanin-16 [Fukomys damarensis]|uniref:LOW QUALITY PROTEIN: tetraspanin-16 n=1 Tax=Fukomys damarensis TaxID=885580 RepID=UPI00053FAB87|nr:LOW QUALITY PROTEIN: tetraspanin-16 [Fukomys damarensis]